MSGSEDFAGIKDRIYLLNSSIKSSGVGRYAYQIYEGLDYPVHTYSLILDPRKSGEFFGNIIGTNHKIKILDRYTVNTVFERVAFREFFSTLRESAATGKNVIHYMQPIIKPIWNLETSSATIYDLFDLNLHLNSNIRRFKKFPHILTMSNHITKILENESFEGKIQHVYPFVSHQFRQLAMKAELRRKHGLPVDKKLVLSIGTNIPRKNTAMIQNTMEKLGSEYNLVRVGDPLEKAYNFRVQSDQTLNELYNSCDVLLEPSLDEGFGYPVIEAMASGLPVVASDIEVFREVCGGSAILSENSLESYVKSIKEAIDNQELIEKGLMRSGFFSEESFKFYIKKYFDEIINQ